LPEDEQVSDKHLIPFIPINSPCTLWVCTLQYFLMHCSSAGFFGWP
jgi:hypothetical protein